MSGPLSSDLKSASRAKDLGFWGLAEDLGFRKYFALVRPQIIIECCTEVLA